MLQVNGITDLHNHSKSDLISYIKDLEKLKNNVEQQYLTRQQVAERFNCSIGTVDRLRSDGKIKGVKFVNSKCGAVRFPLTEIMKFENNGLQDA